MTWPRCFLCLALVHVLRLVAWFAIEDWAEGRSPVARYRARVTAWQQ